MVCQLGLYAFQAKAQEYVNRANLPNRSIAHFSQVDFSIVCERFPLRPGRYVRSNPSKVRGEDKCYPYKVMEAPSAVRHVELQTLSILSELADALEVKAPVLPSK